MKGAKAEDIVEFLLDYNRHKTAFPSVIASKLIERKGDTVKGFLKFKYKKVITAVLNSEHKAVLTRLKDGKFFIRVVSTRIAEVEDYNAPDEHELPVGKDSGFMWRLNTYWFLEQQKDGVLLECRSLTLTRDIPFGLGWAIKPFIESIPRDSLEELITGTRRELTRKSG